MLNGETTVNRPQSEAYLLYGLWYSCPDKVGLIRIDYEHSKDDNPFANLTITPVQLFIQYNHVILSCRSYPDLTLFSLSQH